MREKPKPSAKTVRGAIRASVPEGKLKKARIVLTDEGFRNGSIGGFTAYEREHGGEVVKIGAPQGDRSRDITVRGHETRHAARHKPQRLKPRTVNGELASQIVDDVNIECTKIPNVKSERAYRRAHLVVALQDLRQIRNRAKRLLKGTEPNTVAVRNWQLVLAVRVLAMLNHYGTTGHYGALPPMPPYLADCEGIRTKYGRILQDLIGRKTIAALRKVIALAVKRRSRNRAIGLLEGLMEKELTPAEEEREEEELLKSPPPEGGILGPVQEGSADPLDGHMSITQLLPRNTPCDKEEALQVRHSPYGVIINPSRFVPAIVSGNGHGLFSKHIKRKAGGTILIDASGSMHATAHNLSALCKLCPSATVAYYSGYGKRGTGELCVYALNGKRYGKELPEQTVHGGNSVDLPAIRWMMRLPKPWTLISDLGFCGGALGAEAVAHALVERATQRGELTVYPSLDAAYEAFGGKGELRN